jgi:hypothetical protein
MRFKVELLDEVFGFLRHYCTVEEKQDFQNSLRRVSESPVTGSERHIDPALGPYELRRFRFGAEKRKIAVFELDAAESRIKVIECRLFKQKRGSGRDAGGEAPSV